MNYSMFVAKLSTVVIYVNFCYFEFLLLTHISSDQKYLFQSNLEKKESEIEIPLGIMSVARLPQSLMLLKKKILNKPCSIRR